MSLWDWVLLMILLQVPFGVGYGLIAWALWSTYTCCPHCGGRMHRHRRRCPSCTSWVDQPRGATCTGLPS